MRQLPDTPQMGIILMTVAMFIVPTMDMFAKLLTAHMSAGSVALVRFAMQTVILLPFILFARQGQRPNLLHLYAGFFMGSALIALNIALKVMPIANAIAIFFIEPLILTLLSAVFLKEKIGIRRISAVLIGLLGALIVIRPNWSEFGYVSIFPMITALCFACYLLLTRVMSQNNTNKLAMQFWVGLFAAVLISLSLIVLSPLEIASLQFTAPSLDILWMIIAMGGLAALTHWIIAHAFARGEASTLAPLQYLEIFAATLIGLIVFNDFPDIFTWIGAFIIILSGVYVFRREQTVSKTN